MPQEYQSRRFHVASLACEPFGGSKRVYEVRDYSSEHAG